MNLDEFREQSKEAHDKWLSKVETLDQELLLCLLFNLHEVRLELKIANKSLDWIKAGILALVIIAIWKLR